MLTVRASLKARQSGFTLLEVLITLIILTFGLLGLANLQTKMHVTELESYQRAQAVLLLQDMSGRMYNNRGAGAAGAAAYVTATPLGTDDATYNSTNGYTTTGSCHTHAPALNQAQMDQCEWSLTLQGAGEAGTQGGVTSNVGAMIGARGCIEELQAPNNVTGSCAAGVYRITVAWQGLGPTFAPRLTCGKDAYDAETKRRVVSTVLTIGVPSCTPT